MTVRPNKGRAPSARVAQSFSPGEVGALKLLFSTLMRGGDPRVFLRTTAMLSLQRKVLNMHAAVERQKSFKVLAEAPPLPQVVVVLEQEHE